MTDVHITDAEYRVLRAVAAGRGTKEAAKALGVSDQTVKNHLTAIYRKLGVPGIVGAYGALGWLQTPE